MRPATIAFVFALSLGLAVFVQPAAAQADASDIIAVGEMAPDFTVTGATRYGVLQDPVRLSDLRGEVVVLAFFFRARTPG
jgi:peroxiredoxin Q/BCP